MLKRCALLVLLALLGGAGWYGYRWVTAVPPDPLLLAQTRLDARDVEGAQALARRVVRADPRNVGAHLMLARIAGVLADWASMEREAKALRALGYDRLIVMPMLTQAYIMQGMPQSALAELPTLAGRPEEQAVNLALRSRAVMEMNDRVQAKSALDAAVQIAPKNPVVMLQQARMALAPGTADLALAMAKVEEVLQQRPDSLQALLLKSQVLAAQNDLDGAERELGLALTLTPASPQLHLARAGLLIRLGKDDAAQADVEAALAVAPHDVDAAYMKAVLLLHDNRLAEGVAELQKLGVEMDRRPEGYLLRAQAEAQMGNVQAALDSLDRLLRLQPGQAEALRMAARLSLQAGQPSRSAGMLEQLVRDGKDDAEVEDLLGRAYFQLGQMDDAIRSYGKAVAMMPGNRVFEAHLAAAKRQFGTVPLPGGAPEAPGPSSD